MNIQRALIGFIGTICIVVGLYLTLANEGDNNSLSGILIRIGMMMAATWLAYPVLQRPDGQQSLWVIAGLMLLVLVVAARPKLFVLLVVFLAVAAVGNWLMKKISSNVS